MLEILHLLRSALLSSLASRCLVLILLLRIRSAGLVLAELAKFEFEPILVLRSHGQGES